MQIIEKDINELKPYEKNPRRNDMSVGLVANSIQEFGFKVPMVIDKNGVIVAGHTRYKAAKQLGMKTVPCVVADDLDEEQIKAFRLADNKVSEYSLWDMDLLSQELNDLLDFDMSDFGFVMPDETIFEEVEPANPYSKEVKVPQYEPTGKFVETNDLVDLSKTNMLIHEIMESDIDEDIKEFLIEAAHRHSVFNYRNIAEYYAKADKDVQELMERSALVIIDINDAIANGFVKLSKTIEEIMEEE